MSHVSSALLQKQLILVSVEKLGETSKMEVLDWTWQGRTRNVNLLTNSLYNKQTAEQEKDVKSSPGER